MRFFRSNCSHADFVFKGDDDILLNPRKAAEKINNMARDRNLISWIIKTKFISLYCF